MKKTPKPFWGLLWMFLLAACSLFPLQQTSSSLDHQVPVQSVLDYVDPDTGELIKIENTVRFAPVVPTSSLQAPEPETISWVEQTIQEMTQNTGAQSGSSSNSVTGSGSSGVSGSGISGSSTSQPGFHVLSFSAAGGSQQIHIPASGSFRLTIQEGEQFNILDSDARDGAARVQLPAGHFEMLLKLRASAHQPRLKVEDRLYYVEDELTNQEWYRLGLRPLPVPAAWHSPEQNRLVLHFTTHQVQGFQLSWTQKNEDLPLPAGIQEIGPAGGYIELPNVGELDIPAGALDVPTVIVLRQKEEVLSSGDVDGIPGEDIFDVAPPMELFPDGLQFKRPAFIRLKIDPQKVRGYMPGDIRYGWFSNDFGTPSGTQDSMGDLERSSERRQHPDYYTFEEWYEIQHFSHVRVVLQQHDYNEELAADEDSFIVAATFQRPCPAEPQLNPPAHSPQYLLQWYSEFNANSQRELRLQTICQTLLKSWQDFSALSGNYPQKWAKISFQGQEYSVIPVRLKNIDASGRAYADQTNGFKSAKLEINPGAPFDALIHTIGHENYHAFQIAHVQPYSGIWAYSNPWGTALKNTDGAWMIESSARFMGSWSAYQHFEAYKAMVPAYLPEQALNFQYDGAYGDSLIKGVSLLKNTSLYTTPNTPGFDSQYARMNLFSLIRQAYGTSAGLQKIHDSNKHYLASQTFSSEGAVKALRQGLGDLQAQFPVFAALAALKDYGMGTENPDSFPPPVLNRLSNELARELDVVNYAQPIAVPANATQASPFALASGQLDALQAHFYYAEYAPAAQTFLMAYVYLDSVSAQGGLSAQQAEALIGQGARVLVYNAPASDTWEGKKPQVAILRNAAGANIEGKLRLAKRKLRIGPGVREVYATMVPVPLSQDRIRLLLSLTHPLANGTQPRISYTVKTLFAGIGLFSAALPPADQTYTRLLLTASGLDPEDTWVIFEGRDGQAIRQPAEQVTSSQVDENGLEIQEVLVQVPNHAKVSGQIYLASHDQFSNALDDAALVCNMLPEDFTLAAQRPCGLQLQFS